VLTRTITQAYLARIEEVNHTGPRLRAVIETNPNALTQAAALDLERQTRGPLHLKALHGIPILVKDSIGTMHEDGKSLTRVPTYDGLIDHVFV
jgi:amidase